MHTSSSFLSCDLDEEAPLVAMCHVLKYDLLDLSGGPGGGMPTVGGKRIRDRCVCKARLACLVRGAVGGMARSAWRKGFVHHADAETLE